MKKIFFFLWKYIFFLYFLKVKEEAFLKIRKDNSLLFLSLIFIFIINLILLAVLTRIKLAISSVTGRRVNHYTTEPLVMVPKAGLEPARGNPHGILSPTCLAIPPFGPNLAEAAGLEPTTVGSEGRRSTN